MAQKSNRTTTSLKTFKSASSKRPDLRLEKIDWLDPEIIRFDGIGLPPEEGFQTHVTTFQQPAFWQMWRPGFGRKKDEIGAEWRKIVGQISTILDSAVPVIKDFKLEEITFKLGFSAEGHIVFVAKGGLEATISAKFKRKSDSITNAADS